MKLVIFDYDGVVMDTFAAIKRIYSDTSSAFNLNLPDNDAFYKDLLELDWRITLAKLKIISKKDIAKQEKIYIDGLKKYDDIIRPYLDIKDALEKLSKKYTIAIVSNAYKEEIEYRLKKHNLRDFFKAVFTPADGELKPHPDLLKKCMKQFNTMPSETAFIGDMDGDIACGKSAKISKIIAVTYGFHLKHRLKDADIIIDSPKELLTVL